MKMEMEMEIGNDRQNCSIKAIDLCIVATAVAVLDCAFWDQCPGTSRRVN